MHFPNSLAATLALNTLHSISAPAIPSKGCHAHLPPGLTPGGGTQNYTLNSPLGGGNRNYLVHLPPHYSPQNNKPSPLILVLHAFSQDPHSIESQSGLSEATTNTKYITVYPQGINNVWLGDPGAPNASVVDDRPFINDLLDELEATLCIDTARIYTTGFSNGGGLSGLLACYPATSRRIAASSGVSAAYYTKQSLGYSLFEGGEQGGCQPGGNRPRKLPFLDIHGDADMVIAYSGDNSAFDVDQNGVPDPNTLAVPTWLADWAERNGCPSLSPSPETQEEQEEELSVEAYLETGVTLNASTWLQGDTVQRSSWSCGGWSDVVVGYYIKGLGHGWPSTVPLDEQYEAFRLGPFKWNASAVLMDWFGRWTLPAEKKENM